MPCNPARARELLSLAKARVFRFKPFTVILIDREEGDTQPLEQKFDPGSKTTGIALVAHFAKGKKVIFAINLEHRGRQIKEALEKRRALRSSRRSRKTRYRQPRFDNRTRPQGWLPPSLSSRVQNVFHWSKKLLKLSPCSEIMVETVRFDTQKLLNPEISGIEYQQGELFGYEVREYLLEKWNRKCAYCDTEHTPLEIEHIVPKSSGGSNRISNLTLACRPCNLKKGAQPVAAFLKDKKKLDKIQVTAKASLKDAAAVNATRYAIGNTLKSFGLPVTFWTGGRTKFNRVCQSYPKDHWIDAACVGESGSKIYIPKSFSPLLVKAESRGSRQQCRVDKFGFPRTKAKAEKRVRGFQTGDRMQLRTFLRSG